MPILQFQPLSSQASPSFWTALTAHKLDHAKLDDAPVSISGWMTQGRVQGLNHKSSTPGDDPKHSVVRIDGSVHVGANAFGGDSESLPLDAIPVEGLLRNFNTIEDFQSVDKKRAMFDAVVQMMMESFDSTTPILNPFLMVAFADLKKYVYHYWFAFPALVSKPAWEIEAPGMTVVSDQEILEMLSLSEEFARLERKKPVAFLVKGTPGHRSVASLSSFGDFFATVSADERFVAFHDTSSSIHPGWPLRNILYYLHQVFGVRQINVVCLRGGSRMEQGLLRLADDKEETSPARAVAVGWQRDGSGKLASRIADLSTFIDPDRLAKQAVDLNLKLMKWRVMPTIDLDAIRNTKCLLLGAGTLGCYVARNLMPLFNFEDCLDGGQYKALCAAQRIKQVYPGISSEGHVLDIPMPGHPWQTASKAWETASVSKLDKLIEDHDVVFLLTDSRESRWLPTVIAAAKGTLVINAALGFDTFLVMRHGKRSHDDDVSSSDALGCYFCNDVMAPGDSLRDRSLDQMCTVTRPGVAPIAAALAAELMVSALQLHKLDEYTSDRQALGPPICPFGAVPHQIRGSLSQWKTVTLEGQAFDCCTACSANVVKTYRTEGVAFTYRVCNRPGVLEQLTGLDQLYQESEVAYDMLDKEGWSDDSE
ncbi:E1-like protein-activating enzyme Gsa7p/Apg7p [Kwoniella sp. DSM 27419]